MKLDFLEIKAQAKPVGQWQPLEFMGSMLRGAFGTALKPVVCVRPEGVCEGCGAASRCLYYVFFEEKNRFHPYRFDLRMNRPAPDFKLLLFGQAAQKSLFAERAIETMLEQIGLGAGRTRFEIARLEVGDVQSFEPKGEAGPGRLRFVTPLRIKQGNVFLREKPPLEAVLASIHNRYRELSGLEKTRLDFTPLYREAGVNVRFMELERYSNRQQTAMNLGGVIGHVDYSHLDAGSVRLLRLGEVLGVGKSTVFGLGKIEFE